MNREDAIRRVKSSGLTREQKDKAETALRTVAQCNMATVLQNIRAETGLSFAGKSDFQGKVPESWRKA